MGKPREDFQFMETQEPKPSMISLCPRKYVSKSRGRGRLFCLGQGKEGREEGAKGTKMLAVTEKGGQSSEPLSQLGEEDETENNGGHQSLSVQQGARAAGTSRKVSQHGHGPRMASGSSGLLEGGPGSRWL